MLYLRWLTFFRNETSGLFFSLEPCARLKTILVKVRPRVLMLCRVIARWVNEKLHFPLKLHINRVFFFFFCALPLCYILFIWFICSKNVSKHSLTHIIAKKCNFCLRKIAKNDDFGDFNNFNVFRHDVKKRYVRTFS